MKYSSALCKITVTCMLTLTAPAAASPTSIEVWMRTAGNYGTDNIAPPKTAPVTIALESLPQKQVQRSDVQYDTTSTFRGVLLRDIIAKYKPAPNLDLVLLHFRNGMIVPLPFRDEKAMRRLDPLIALGMSADPQGPFRPEFPPIVKRTEGYADIPRVTFSGNKIVVNGRWHPDVPSAAVDGFTPWALTDTLQGIEFAEDAAYYRQFIPSADVQRGFEVFRGSCQYCHGVRKVGAHFGWDYAQPLELHTYRNTPMRLFNHIQYKVEYKAVWSMMPALQHITEAQAGQIWNWMKAVSTTPIGRYTPTH